MNDRSFAIPVAIVLGGVIVALAVYLSIAPPLPKSDSGNPELVRPVSAADHILGNPAAPVVIVEYADFDCEYCKGFNDILHQIVANGGGDVAVVFRHFPLSEIHPNALSHARAAECAAEAGGNDAFWNFVDELFASQPISTGSYGERAAKAGISGDAFASCYANASATFDEHIMADRKNALLVGALGTPYSLILVSGKTPVVMSGAYPYDEVKLRVDHALSP